MAILAIVGSRRYLLFSTSSETTQQSTVDQMIRQSVLDPGRKRPLPWLFHSFLGMIRQHVDSVSDTHSDGLFGRSDSDVDSLASLHRYSFPFNLKQIEMCPPSSTYFHSFKLLSTMMLSSAKLIHTLQETRPPITLYHFSSILEANPTVINSIAPSRRKDRPHHRTNVREEAAKLVCKKTRHDCLRTVVRTP